MVTLLSISWWDGTRVYNSNIYYMYDWHVGMIVIDANGNMAGGTSTNGASYKVPG